MSVANTPTGAVWTPDPATAAGARITRFARELGLDDLDQLEVFASEQPERFWAAAVTHLGLRWQRPPSAVVGPVTDHVQSWFVDARFNLADNAVTRWVDGGRGGETAVLAADETGASTRLTWAELDQDVRRAAAALRSLGLVPGDAVAIQLPMVLEAVVLTLACARVGVVVVPLFSGFGGEAALARISHAGARVHFVSAGYRRRGRSVDSLTTAREVADSSPGLTTVVVGLRASAVGKETSWSEVLSASDGAGPAGDAAELPADHPLMIAYTSGTTGRPKGVVLDQAGFAVKAGTDAAWFFDLKPGDVASWVTDPGWVMFPITVLGGLLAGSSVALYDGAVDHPTPTVLWDFVEQHGITFLGVSPTLVRTLMGVVAVPPTAPSRLRVLGSSGEPWTPDAFAWLSDAFGRGRLPVINYSGGTEVSGGILSNTVADPVVPGGFARAIPGMGADVVDDGGQPVRDRMGHLVLRCHAPGMTRGFHDDDRYERTYWTAFPGLWSHGDLATRGTDGVWFIHGRSDDTLKIAGKRLGPAEVESAVNACEAVAESAAVGVPDPVKGQALVVFVRPVDELPKEQWASLAEEVATAVTTGLGRALKPARVHVVERLPRNRSGKILRRVITRVYSGQDAGDLSSLEDSRAVDLIEAARP